LHRFGLALSALAMATVVAAGEPPSLQISDAWVRQLPPGQPNTAAYMTITNTGTAPVELVAASSPLARSTEFHRSREVDGYMRMEHLEVLSLAPGQSLKLSPGGVHLMLLGLDHMPAEGESVELCLRSAGGDDSCVQAPTRGVAAQGEPAHHHHE